MSFIVVPDACVLFPASLRDTLLIAAEMHLYTVQLTDDILEEVQRSLINRGMQEEKAQRIVLTIKNSFDESMITRHRPLIDTMPVNSKDRHVLAAAVASTADIIVTQNLKHFPPSLLEPYEVEALSPDKFLVDLYRIDRERMAHVLVTQAGNLRSPSMTVGEVLETLHRHAPKFVSLLRKDFNPQETLPWTSSIKTESDVFNG